MANVAKRPDGRWRARYRDDAGREHAKHFDRRVDAQRWLDQVTAAVVTGQYVDPRAGRITVKQYATGWQTAHVGGLGTARVVDNALRVHVLPRIGSLPMHTVRRAHLQSLVKEMSVTHAPATVSLVFGVASRMFASAVEDRVIPSSPCRKVALPRDTSAEVEPPTVEQVAMLADAVPARYRAAVATLAGTGLRIGELLGLRVDDVDWLRRTLRVERQRNQAGQLVPPKTPSSVRTIPLGQVVVDVLAAHLAQHGGDWLVTEPDGNPTGYRRWRMVWEAAQKATGLDVSTHGLRHFFASALIAGGASVKQVQTVLGHADATITLQTYAHLWPGDDDRTRAVVDATLDVLRTGCGLSAPAESVSAGQEG